MSLPPGTRLDRYEIRSLLGAGGMGEVYRARDTRLGRDVAIKLLPTALADNADRLRRFKQEAQAAAALNHPNIAHIYEIGEISGLHFIAMEFIEGDTLSAKIYGDRAELTRLLKCLAQVADALAKAHAAGIVHRDLKPDNIMVTTDGYAKIVDFGLAKLLEQAQPASAAELSEAATAVLPAQHSTPGLVMGTVGYMSPEQAQGHAVDHRSDIFSFGCILYEAATGHRPFEADSAIDTLHKIIHDPAPAVSDFNPSAPPGLQRIIRKCLVKEPEKRYQVIRDVANDLEELLEELHGTSELERSVAPAAKTTTSGAVASAQTKSITGESAERVAPHSASSAEYIVTEIKRHRRGVILALAALLVAAAVGAYFYFWRSDRAAIDSIAVLPFTNSGGDPNVEYLSDGISESLINGLTQLQQLKVIARSTAFRYKNKEVDPQAVGRELNVRAVLMGRVRQAGDRLNIQVDLVDAATGAQLWGATYERAVADALPVQQAIAREVMEKLRLKLSGEQQQQLARRETTNPEAYQFYLRGRHFWNKRTTDGLRKAIEQFQRAIEHDPNYALGYVGLSDCYAMLEEYTGAPSSETLPLARAAVDRALQINDSLAEAHTALAHLYQNQWRWAEAEQEYRRAISLNPNYATAHQWFSIYFRVRRQFDDALREIKRAQELDPLSPVISVNVATVHQTKNDINAALAQYQRVIALDPNFPGAHSGLGWIYLKQRRYEDALAEYQKAAELSGRSSGSLGGLGYCYAVTGRRAEALQILRELEERYARREALGGDLAAVHFGLGDRDRMFEWLEKDFQQRSSVLPSINSDPDNEPLRTDPRFIGLVRRMGLEP